MLLLVRWRKAAVCLGWTEIWQGWLNDWEVPYKRNDDINVEKSINLKCLRCLPCAINERTRDDFSEILVCGHPISTGDLISCSLLSHRLFFPTPLCPVSCHPIYVSGNIILSETKQKTLQFDDTHIRIHSKPKINGIYRNMLRVCYVMLYILYIPIVRCTYIGYICGGDRIPSASSTLIIIYASGYPFPTLCRHPMKITCGFSFYSVSDALYTIHDVSSVDVWSLKLCKEFPRRALSSVETIFHWFQVFSNEKLNTFTMEDERFVAGCCYADTKENTNTENEWLSFPNTLLYISVNEYFRWVLPTIPFFSSCAMRT